MKPRPAAHSRSRNAGRSVASRPVASPRSRCSRSCRAPCTHTCASRARMGSHSCPSMVSPSVAWPWAKRSTSARIRVRSPRLCCRPTAHAISWAWARRSTYSKPSTVGSICSTASSPIKSHSSVRRLPRAGCCSCVVRSISSPTRNLTRPASVRSAASIPAATSITSPRRRSP